MAENAFGSLLAIFWDIENCGVPRGKSAMAVVDCLRNRFLSNNAKEAEFLCVCDVSKEPASLISELNDSQVTVVHISNEHKNAADDKLKQRMRKFCDTHKAPVTLVLVSADVDFAADLSHMRHSHNYRIILVHNKSSVKPALTIAADEICKFDDIVQNVPEKEQFMTGEDAVADEVHLVKLTGLPTNVDLARIKSRLYSMANKTKGTMIHCSKKFAIVQYTQSGRAARAAKRMSQQDVFGTRISAMHIGSSPSSAIHNLASDGPPAPHNSAYHQPPGCLLAPAMPSHISAGAGEPLRGALATPPDSGLQMLSPTPTGTHHEANFNFSRTPGRKSKPASPCDSGLSTPNSALGPGSLCSAPQKLYQRYPFHRNVALEASAAAYDNGFPPCPQLHNIDTYAQTPYRRTQCSTYINTSAFHQYHGPRKLFGVPSLSHLEGINAPSQATSGLRPILRQSGCMRSCDDTPSAPTGNEPVALAITNLDYNITAKEWRNILHQTFQQSVQVLNVKVQTQHDGSTLALVYVLTREDARFAISQFHRKKIGYKRIQVSLYTPTSPNNPQRIRLEVASILREVSGHTMPLFKFVEIYEKRFHRSISVAELYHMKDTVEIKENTAGNGRMLCLQTILGLPNYMTGSSSNSEAMQLPGSPYCALHCSQSDFTLIEESGMLPYVKMNLITFSQHVYTLLTMHKGELHLMSFLYCYAAIYTKLVPTVEGGVPLEHLISCVSGVQIKEDLVGIKKVSRQEGRPTSPGSMLSEVSSNEWSAGRTSYALNQQLSQFSREVVDLLKRMPGCQMSFSKFIPSYHHHFGRQCRVADFGFTKLLELFEAIPHVLQILGTGNQRVLYLTHRIHLRRFTADLCHVLKAQQEKQCSIADFPERYSEVIGAELNMANFGVCYVKDILQEVSESQVLVITSGEDTIMSIPKKDQTPEEIEKTKQFSYEVIDLLKNCPQCTMVFNKFIPAYHHHFGRQCRVADYGFAKLIELFEAIPEVVNITESGEERYISLTTPELYKVLSDQILAVLKHSPTNALDIKEFGSVYHKAYGHKIYIEEFGVTSLEDLVERIPHIAYVENRAGASTIVLKNKLSTECLARRCLELLMAKSNGVIRLHKFMERYLDYYGDSADLVNVRHSLSPAILITEDETCGTISLHPLLGVARRIMILLTNNQGKLTLLTFEMAFRQCFGTSLDSQECGYPGVTVMLQIMDFMVSIRGRGARQTILLRQDYISRLAHQLVYKVGIYTELVKYKDVPTSKTKPLTTSNCSAALDNFFMVKNESIVACSPDMFGGTPTTAPHRPTSNIYPTAGLTPELNEARKALAELGISQQAHRTGPPVQLAAVPRPAAVAGTGVSNNITQPNGSITLLHNPLSTAAKPSRPVNTSAGTCDRRTQ